MYRTGHPRSLLLWRNAYDLTSLYVGAEQRPYVLCLSLEDASEVNTGNDVNTTVFGRALRQSERVRVLEGIIARSHNARLASWKVRFYVRGIDRTRWNSAVPDRPQAIDIGI